MLNDIKYNWEKDYDAYKNFLESRVYFTNTEFEEEFQLLYQKIFLYTTLTEDICGIDTRSKIKDFFFACKNNLIISFDLANINYLNSSKQILRSSIESFFRLSLGLSKYIEYRENKKKGIYNATQKLKDLKSMQECHKVGKMTLFVKDNYSSTPVKDLYCSLYDLYSNLSGAVHTNDSNNFTPHKYLIDYTNIDRNRINEHIKDMNTVIDSIIIIIYYFSFQLIEENVSINKRDLMGFERISSNSSYLDLIQEYFH